MLGFWSSDNSPYTGKIGYNELLGTDFFVRHNRLNLFTKITHWHKNLFVITECSLIIELYLTEFHCTYKNSTLRTEIKLRKFFRVNFSNTVKPEYNDHPRDPKIVVVVDRWSFQRFPLYTKCGKQDAKIVVVVDRWSLFGGGL